MIGMIRLRSLRHLFLFQVVSSCPTFTLNIIISSTMSPESGSWQIFFTMPTEKSTLLPQTWRHFVRQTRSHAKIDAIIILDVEKLGSSQHFTQSLSVLHAGKPIMLEWCLLSGGFGGSMKGRLCPRFISPWVIWRPFLRTVWSTFEKSNDLFYS